MWAHVGPKARRLSRRQRPVLFANFGVSPYTRCHVDQPQDLSTLASRGVVGGRLREESPADGGRKAAAIDIRCGASTGAGASTLATAPAAPAAAPAAPAATPASAATPTAPACARGQVRQAGETPTACRDLARPPIVFGKCEDLFYPVPWAVRPRLTGSVAFCRDTSPPWC
jgi:hypothetical protein